MKDELRTIINCATYALNELAKYSDYDKWSGEFCKSEAKTAMEGIREELKKVDHTKLDKEESLLAGFGRWNETTILCPLYIQPVLLPDADNDVRCSCISEGWEIAGNNINWDKKKDIFTDEDFKSATEENK